MDDFWGKEGCNDMLVLSRPDIIKDIHAAFFKVGCDVVETNTFGSTRIVLAEYDLQDKVHEINLAAAKLAREVAASFSSNGRKRFVAGSMGPTTKLPSLGHISFDDMAAAYTEQAVALIEGGVDVLLLETCQDILQAKAGLVGIFDALKKTGKNVPVQVQVTLEATGTMLLGTEIGAALTTLEMFDVAVIGMNCATGPKEMNDAVRYLGANSPKHVSVLPNAGLPQNVGGRAVYKLQPQELADYHKQFITEYGVRIVGGCCGTTPEHLKAVVDTCANLEPAKRDVKITAAAASAYSMVPLDLDPKPLIVAEEMNTTTRVEHFKNMVRTQNYDAILTLAKKLVNEGSHMLDLCCAIVGEDEKGYISNILEKIATRVPAPITVDSTEADVVEEALKRIPGKAIINSINLEDGEKRTVESSADGQALWRGGHRADHRRRRHGADRGEEAGDRQAHLRSGGQQVRHSSGGSHLRRADAADLDRAGRLSHRRHRNAEGGEGDQDGAARGEDDPRRQQHFVRPERLFAARAEQRLHARSGRPRPRHGHRELQQDLSAVQDSRSGSRSRAQADLTTTSRTAIRCRSTWRTLPGPRARKRRPRRTSTRSPSKTS